MDALLLDVRKKKKLSTSGDNLCQRIEKDLSSIIMNAEEQMFISDSEYKDMKRKELIEQLEALVILLRLQRKPVSQIMLDTLRSNK